MRQYTGNRYIPFLRLIQKIYEVDSLACPRCQGKMSIISFIENEELMRRILEHFGLWLVKRIPQPRANAPPVQIPKILATPKHFSRREAPPPLPSHPSQSPAQPDNPRPPYSGTYFS
jgi:hypothetical protein